MHFRDLDKGRQILEIFQVLRYEACSNYRDGALSILCMPAQKFPRFYYDFRSVLDLGIHLLFQIAVVVCLG